VAARAAVANFFVEVKCGLILRSSYASCGSNKMHPCEEPPRAIYPSEDGCYNVLSDRRQVLIYMPHLHATISRAFSP